MYLPGPSALLDSTSPTRHFIRDGSHGITGGGWSSLIGIITAIIGNILISFALNTQRYAHMRLRRDRDEWEEKQKARRKRSRSRPRTYGSGGNYGSHGTYERQQDDVAEQRARDNAQSEPEGKYKLEDAAEITEADPLIPRVDTRRLSASSDDEHARADDSNDDEADDDDDDDERQAKSYLRSPIWWLGIALMTVGETGNFLAYGFAPASIVSPLGVVALVSNCMIAPLLLGEQFRWRDAVGVVIAVGGCVTVVLSASDSNPRLTPNSIWHLITRWEFETYFGITLALIVALMVASNRFGDKTVLIDLGLVGMFGGYTALSTKGIASLLSNTIWRVVTFPITYLLLAVLISTAVMQIKYVNRALQRFNATVVIPTQFVLFTISVIVGSAILYRDFERQQADDAAKFFAGCALTFLGVWCITSGRSDDSAEGQDGEDDEDEEDAIDLIDEEHVQPEIRERDDGPDRRRSLIPSSSAESPQLQRFRTRDTIPPSVVVTPDFRPTSGPHAPLFELESSPFDIDSLPPATTSAIHSQSMSQLPQESDVATDSRKPPPLHATTSAPVVPQAELSPFRPRTPLNRNKTAIESPVKRSPPTPLTRQQSQGQHLDPNVPTTSARRLTRHPSVAGLLPGPLTSPLSSSLSAIVADSLRRDASSTLRRRQSRAGGGGVGGGSKRPGMDTAARKSSAFVKRHSIASGEMNFEDEAEAARLRVRTGSPPGRMRSLSATVGDLFTGSAASGSASVAKRPRGQSIREDGEEGAR